jgi:hypothetical protein
MVVYFNTKKAYANLKDKRYMRFQASPAEWLTLLLFWELA